MRICSLCGNTYEYDRSKGHRGKICSACRTKKRHYVLKLRMIEYLGGQCSVCGYDKCPAAMHFHHLNARQKEFSLGGAYNRSWKALTAELDKCIILCANCHAEKHFYENRRF